MNNSLIYIIFAIYNEALQPFRGEALHKVFHALQLGQSFQFRPCSFDSIYIYIYIAGNKSVVYIYIGISSHTDTCTQFVLDVVGFIQAHQILSSNK